MAIMVPNCADYTVLREDRSWVIELRTEAASHRPGEIPSSFELARHHHPDRLLEVTYLTPPLSLAPTPQALAGRFLHLMSGDVPAETMPATAARRLGGRPDTPATCRVAGIL